MTPDARDTDTVADARSERVEPDVPAARSEADMPIRVFADDEPSEGPGDKQPPAKSYRRWIRPALFALVPIALVAGGYIYATGGRIVSTDDAYVNARQVGISTDVSGVVAEVDVRENQHVDLGQVLYRLDRRQFEIALDNAKSRLANVAISLEAMKADYQQMLATAAAQDAQVKLDEATYRRAAALIEANAIAKASFDQANFALLTDASKLDALRQQVASELVKLGGDAGAPVNRLPQYLEAEAEVREAQRQLTDTIVRAPFSGTVTSVPSIAPGKYLAASTVAFFLVDTDHLWIDATPKETELTYVRPGQRATITVDTYPGLAWHGVVQTISPAAAQEFQLLPAQNTSGNWVKVVQRVPLRVSVEPGGRNAPPLRAGMSVEVEVNTGHARGLF
jgi:membrane fusion protein, multidrug efflux system